MSRVGVITILYNSNNVLEGFFKSLSKQTYKDYRLYIIDNTPSFTTDGILKLLLNKYPISSHLHIKSEGNIGFAKGNNIAIKMAIKDECEFILLTNNDIEFEQEFLLESLVASADYKGESLIIPKILYYDSKNIWMAGGRFVWWKATGVHVGEHHNSNRGKYNKQGYYDFAPLCIMLIRSEVFDVVGKLDENYFVYYEDTDFLYRAVKKGYRIFYNPNLEVLHKVGSSTGGDGSLFCIYYGNRNRIYFIEKHFSIGKKIIVYPLLFISRFFKYIKFNSDQRKELIKALKAGFKVKSTSSTT